MNTINDNAVIEVLKQCFDPEIPIDLWNLGLIYKDIPDGFFHRSVVPVNKNTKRVEKYCLIKHLSNKYANEKNNKYLANIKIEDIYY